MPNVVAVIATYRRPAELQRLCESFSASTHPLHGAVIVDNANDAATEAVAKACKVPVRYVPSEINLGCGGGLAFAEEVAFREFPELTHLWILDDDVVLERETLATLLAAMEKENAGAAFPQVSDGRGNLGWFPGLLDRDKFKAVCRAKSPREFREMCGDKPVPFSWATGVALLVTKKAITQAGFHRTDFWIRGEDLDFSLRLTDVALGIYVPDAHMLHLAPNASDSRVFGERMKDAAMLQNCVFLSLKTKHGRRIAKHQPGNMWRHLKSFGVHTGLDILIALYFGGVRGRPAGVPGADYFRKRLESAAKQ